MSEKYDSDRAMEGSSAGENGDSDGIVHVESSVEPSGVLPETESRAGGSDGGDVSVSVESVDVADMRESVVQADHVDHGSRVMDDSIKENPTDVKASEDGGKEEMFVDCPDELTTFDGRTPDSKEAIKVSETSQRSEEKDDVHDTHSNVSENGTQDHDSMSELDHLRDMLEKTISEKDRSAGEYKEERVVFMRELAHLHHQLKALTEQRLLLDEKDGGLVDYFYKAEIGNGEDETLPSDASLHEMINECSNFAKSALDERSQTEGTLRELHAILYMKDQEIEDLDARVNELSLSRDVVFSYLNSIQENFSRSLQVSSEIQLEKDQHIVTITNRILGSLGETVNQEDCLEETATQKISQVERGTSFLIEKYNRFLSEIELLRQCLVDVTPDLSVQGEVDIIVTACQELVELKRKYVNLDQKLSHLEDESRKLVEQLDKQKELVEMANSELRKLKVELEQEKTKYANTKEKLSLAVTKGKALVQQRDSLKQSLADKTSELEKCLVELQEKSTSLEAAELSKEELVKSESLAASMQEALTQRDMILRKCEEILSEIDLVEELQSMDTKDRVRWLVHERNALKSVSVEFHKLKDALSWTDLPEAILSSDLESRVSWLVESVYLAKDETAKLQDEIAKTREAAQNEIGRLTTSFLAESQENNFLREELKDLTSKYAGSVEKEHQVSLEKDQMVIMLLEASGNTIDRQEYVYQDMAMIINRCFGKIKEEISASLQTSDVEAEMFERIQSLLYIRDQESMLYEQILEEEMLDRSEVNHLSNELLVVSQELHALKDEKGSLQKDLKRYEEKAALLRDKLSMAVKKGKGLVQDREHLKQLLDEKNAEIEKLKFELQKQESAFNDCRDQISLLSTDVERIPKLEADLVALKDERDQLERFLVESNNMLQRVIESIDGIILPVDLVFEEPEQKVKWLAGYLSECEAAKTQVEQELGKVKDEAGIFASKLAESQTIMKSLEDALSITEKNISELADEKRELEVAKTYVEQELKKAMEEASCQSSRLAEVSATKKSLEDSLARAEDNVSLFLNEKEDAQVSRAAAEMELEKVKEEVAVITGKLDEAYSTIQSLEYALSEVHANVSLLSEENNKAQVGKINVENELKQLKEEADSHASRAADASLNVKSLENALLKAENNISDLVGEKKIAEQEISTLNSKLNACMQELAGTHGNMENRVLELSAHLNSLQLLLKDESLLSSLTQSFEKKYENLKDMDLLLNDVKNHFVEMDSETLHTPVTEEDLFVPNPFPAGVHNAVNFENGEVNVADGDSITLCIAKTVEGFHLRNKILADKFEGFSTFMDDLIAALLKKLQATRDEVSIMFEHMNSLKQKVKTIEMGKQAQETKIVMLENDIKILLSACTDATQELEFEVENKLNHSLSSEAKAVGGVAVAEHELSLGSSKYVETAEKLLFVARNAQSLNEQFQNARKTFATTVEDLQNKLEETRTACERAIEERNLNHNRVFELETDLEALQNMCSDIRLKLDDYQAKENKWEEREAEILSLYPTTKQEDGDALLSTSQMRSLFDKTNGIEIHLADFELEDLELHDSSHVKKLFYIVDGFTRLQHQLNLLSHEKQKLQSTLAEQVLEIEHLTEEVEDSGKMKNELYEIASGLENIIQKLEGDEFVGSQKSAGVNGQLPILEKLVMSIILESENSKSRSEELSVKLLDTQKVVVELSSKVKLLEDSNQNRAASPDTVTERAIFEAPSLPTRSEISEIEDVGPLGNKAIPPPAPSAAHVRTLRKGSSDHLAINIDSESERLINNQESDEDKGHAFKSLNTSGLIPRQGKMIADRIDGIWVSGGRALMSRPRARLALLSYWVVVHIWLLLGAIL